jgi:hypothetical protein
VRFGHQTGRASNLSTLPLPIASCHAAGMRRQTIPSRSPSRFPLIQHRRGRGVHRNGANEDSSDAHAAALSRLRTVDRTHSFALACPRPVHYPAMPPAHRRAAAACQLATAKPKVASQEPPGSFMTITVRAAAGTAQAGSACSPASPLTRVPKGCTITTPARANRRHQP